MTTGRSTQRTRQVGEHLLAADLGRMGIIATPFAEIVPGFDLFVANEAGRAVAVQVKAMNGPSWQFGATEFLVLQHVNSATCIQGHHVHPG